MAQIRRCLERHAPVTPDDEPIDEGWWEMQEEADRRAEAEDDG